MTVHAKLSPSSSARWLNCPGSVALLSQLQPRQTESPVAREGTCAHELAELVLTDGGTAFDWEGKQLIENNAHTVEREMAAYVQEYVDYVKQFDGEHLYEQGVSFSDWVPGGFGTSDAIIMHEGEMHVIDLKYGKGVQVDAEQNTQGMLYALGALNEYGMIYSIDTVRIHIVQPRLDHISEWEIRAADLYKWAEWVRERAELANSDEAPRVPGEKQCQWCEAKAVCPELMKYTHDVIGCDFDALDVLAAPNTLSDAQIRKAMDGKKLIAGWLEAVEAHIVNTLKDGKPFPGYKLVAGRSLRQWGDESKAEQVLVDELGDKAHERKLLSPAKAEKMLGKKKADVLEGLIVKPEGKPTLAPESDKRPAVTASADDFEALDSEE
jgi:CRISPR/Cas system-associated exonuclease Cas4 (RecB family)